MNTPRVGLYAWAGPGTIRLLAKKYHHPRIDESSFLSAYDLPYLERAKELFHVTDMWVTYSWGFSDHTEEADYQFLRTKLPNFKQLGIKTHAYVQGFNVVTDEFKDQNVWCTDAQGRKLPYSKGRSFTCPNNPQAVSIILDRVKKACQEDVGGIYIDNLMFGLPPFYVRTNFVSFFGCSCLYCQTEFKKKYGYALPLSEKRGDEIQDYLNFRSESIMRVVSQARDICTTFQKEFGVNLYDPCQYTPKLYFGYSLADIQPLLDYLLIENHSLPSQKNRSNRHLLPLLTDTKQPVFVVSYNKGIGFEDAYTQHDLDAIFSESKTLEYSPCIKATEFTTNGIWHTLDLQECTAPALIPLPSCRMQKTKKLKASSRLTEKIVQSIQPFYAPVLSFMQEHRWANALYKRSGIYQHALRAFRNYEI